MNNPADKMEYEINWINTQIKQICKSMHVTFENIEGWLQQNRSKLYDDLNKLFNEIDTDVYGKSLKNELDEKESKAWEKKVEEWRNRYLALLNDYWNEHSKSE